MKAIDLPVQAFVRRTMCFYGVFLFVFSILVLVPISFLLSGFFVFDLSLGGAKEIFGLAALLFCFVLLWLALIGSVFRIRDCLSKGPALDLDAAGFQDHRLSVGRVEWVNVEEVRFLEGRVGIVAAVLKLRSGRPSRLDRWRFATLILLSGAWSKKAEREVRVEISGLTVDRRALRETIIHLVIANGGRLNDTWHLFFWPKREPKTGP